MKRVITLMTLIVLIDAKKTLTFFCLTPDTLDIWRAGNAMKVAQKMAIEDINDRDDILADYDIECQYADSACSETLGAYAHIKLLMKPPTKILMIGPACSHNSIVVAYATKRFGTMMISYAAESPVLANKEIYPYFTRTVLTWAQNDANKIDFSKYFGWEKIFVLQKDTGAFTQMASTITKYGELAGVKMVAAVNLGNDVMSSIKILKDYDARIIFTGMWENNARKVLCAAYKLDMYGEKYMWAFDGWFTEKWYMKEDDSIDCTADQMALAAEGYFVIDGVLGNPIEERGLSGYTFKEFKARFDSLVGNDTAGESYAAASYDSIFLAALALNTSLTDPEFLAQGGVDNYRYENEEATKILYKNAISQRFVTVNLGNCFFDENGDQFGLMRFRQLQNHELVRVALNDPTKSFSERFSWDPDVPIVWKGGKPPKDSVIIVNKHTMVSVETHVIFSVVAGIGIVLTLFLIIFNFVFRKKRIIKMSSPNINNMLLFGCILSYISVMVQQTKTSDQAVYYCKIKETCLIMGFAITFGSLLGKTWRVYKIFTNIQLKKKPILDRDLVVYVLALVLINGTILTTWQLVDPKYIELITIEKIEEGDFRYVYTYDKCTSSLKLVFLGAIVGVQGILLLFACFLAFQTRKIKVAEMNDSQAIGLCVYNIFILSLIGVLMNFVLEQQVELLYVLSSVMICIGTTAVEGIIFAPKVYAFFKSGGHSDFVTTKVGTTNVETTAQAKTLNESAE